MERGMNNQFNIRSQRPKGYFKIFKIVVITIICFWLLYQISESLNNKKDEAPILQGLLRKFDKEVDSDIFGRKGNAGRSKEEAFSDISNLDHENVQLPLEGKKIDDYGAGDDEIEGSLESGSVFSQKIDKNGNFEGDKGKRAEKYKLGIVVKKHNDQKLEERYELGHENQKAQTSHVGKKHKEEDPEEIWRSIESLGTTNDTVKQEQDEKASSSKEKDEGNEKKEPKIDEVQGFNDVTGVPQDGNDLLLTESRNDFASNFQSEMVSNDSVEQGRVDDHSSENEAKDAYKEGISDSNIETTADAYTKVEAN